MEWLRLPPGLGEGELELVDVGVVDSLSENRSSSCCGDVVDCIGGSAESNSLQLNIYNDQEFRTCLNKIIWNKEHTGQLLKLAQHQV